MTEKLTQPIMEINFFVLADIKNVSIAESYQLVGISGDVMLLELRVFYFF